MDLEAFDVRQFYDLLNKQSESVTLKIGSQKDEIKSLYQKVAQQTQSLKGSNFFKFHLISKKIKNLFCKDLWAAKMNLKRESCLATSADLNQYERLKEEVDQEVERRKDLGFKISVR